jgi:hypothetical protein
LVLKKTDAQVLTPVFSHFKLINPGAFNFSCSNQLLSRIIP